MRPSLLTFTAATALVLAGCGSSTDDPGSAGTVAQSTPADAMTEESTTDDMAGESMGEESMTDDMAEGSAEAMSGYVELATYQADPAAYSDGTVVLFFHADWCPECRATDEALTADGVPEDLTVVKVDFDTEDDLRQQYGVTQQHTFVQVDAEGNEITKWSGSADGAEILGHTM